MPGIDGIETAKRALWICNHLKMIAVTNFCKNSYMKELICAGFKGCVMKDNLYDHLNKAIETVLENGMYFHGVDF
jgi:DNA-binding NarL/FixJ family response regulator